MFTLFFPLFSFFLTEVEIKFHGPRILVCKHCSRRTQDELMEGRQEALGIRLFAERVSVEELELQWLRALSSN